MMTARNARLNSIPLLLMLTPLLFAPTIAPFFAVDGDRMTLPLSSFHSSPVAAPFPLLTPCFTSCSSLLTWTTMTLSDSLPFVARAAVAVRCFSLLTPILARSDTLAIAAPEATASSMDEGNLYSLSLAPVNKVRQRQEVAL
jgi:hypothetical protein